MHRAEEQRCCRYVALCHYQKQEKHPGTFGTEEIQPVPQESNCSQRNQIVIGGLENGKESRRYT